MAEEVQLPCSISKPHIVLFPFMAKGHTIPLFHLARLLVSRGVLVTVFTTPANHMFIADSLDGLEVSITDLPFPDNVPEIPPGVESTDKLPSMSLFKPFVNGLKLMQPVFDEAIEKIHSQVSCIISDGFLYWTLQSATRFGIPRLTYYGISNYATTILRTVTKSGLLISQDGSPDDEPFDVPGFPWIKVTRYDFTSSTDVHSVEGPYASFVPHMVEATENSYGIVQNSFYELEPLFADHIRLLCTTKIWNVGPLCLTRNNPSPSSTNKSIQWLDQMLAQNRPVVYVAFGSQAALSSERLHELVFGLEQSKVNFLWVLGNTGLELESVTGFGNRVNGRGLIVKEWVDQREILEHEAVQGFFSHCGWNSVIEGICAQVPILAWPMLAEQSLNAIMVSEEIKVGLRVKTVDGSTKGFVTGESLRDSLVELMEGEKRRVLVENVKRLGESARRAVGDGGSSSNALDELIEEVHTTRKRNLLMIMKL